MNGNFPCWVVTSVQRKADPQAANPLLGRGFWLAYVSVSTLTGYSLIVHLLALRPWQRLSLV